MVKTAKKQVIIIDGHNLLFRMFYGMPSSIKNSRGKEIKGVVGFICYLKKLYLELKPYSILVVFDSETSQETNKKVAESYKANRIDYNLVPENENPFSQLPLIKKP